MIQVNLFYLWTRRKIFIHIYITFGYCLQSDTCAHVGPPAAANTGGILIYIYELEPIVNAINDHRHPLKQAEEQWAGLFCLNLHNKFILRSFPDDEKWPKTVTTMAVKMQIELTNLVKRYAWTYNFELLFFFCLTRQEQL